eukprot:COSAG02_NODE_5212_length_4536_cov_11.181839_4_plen_116_part_00
MRQYTPSCWSGGERETQGYPQVVGGPLLPAEGGALTAKSPTMPRTTSESESTTTPTKETSRSPPPTWGVHTRRTTITTTTPTTPTTPKKGVSNPTDTTSTLGGDPSKLHETGELF